jgi:hypothetical protein
MPLRVTSISATTEGLIVSDAFGSSMIVPMPQRLQNLKIINSTEGRANVQKITSEQHVFIYDDQNAAQLKVDVQ